MKKLNLIASPFRNSHVAIAVTRLSDNRFVDANDAFLALFGYQRNEIIGRTAAELGMWPDLRDREGLLDVLSRDGSISGLEVRQQTARGELRHVQVSANLWQHADERYLIGMLTDITERKLADLALRESEERFRLFMDNSPTVAWIKDEAGRHVFQNRNLEQRFGRTRDDWLGKTDYDLFPAEIAETYRENDQKVIATRRAVSFVEESIDEADRRTYWLSTKFPFDDAQGRTHVGGMALDITAAKEVELALGETAERLSLALRGSNLGSWDSDTAAMTVLITGHFCSLLGYAEESRSFAISEWMERVHPEDVPQIQHALNAHLRGDTAIFDSEHRLRHVDGHWVWVHISGKVSTWDAKGNPVRIVGTARDVSARKRLGEEGLTLLQRIEALMREAAAGERSPDKPAPKSTAPTLPTRQRQILRLIARGFTSAQIAKQLQIATGTVISHRRALMERLDLHTTADVTRFAVEHKLLD